MITLEQSISPGVRKEIARRLEAVESEHRVRLLLAVESGSRAWGFPSPDSDHDVRFVYVRERDWYLRLEGGRDVIEYPIEDEIDLGGWDVRKALSLLLRSNAVISEWIDSPIRYRADHALVSKLRGLADAVLDARGTAHHYASLGRNAAERWLEGDDPVPVKRYFYALRPALAIRCLRLSPARRPPMNLQALVETGKLPLNAASDVAALVEAKSRASEQSNQARMPRLDALIRDELGRVAEVHAHSDEGGSFLGSANELFLELVNHDRH